MKRLVPITLTALLIATSGCHLFKRNTVSPPKEPPDIANQVERDFEQRWLEKRTGELVAQGIGPDAARSQAINEFRAKYSYTQAAQQTNPPGK